MCDLAQESSELSWEAEAGRLGHTDLSPLPCQHGGVTQGAMGG